MRALTDDAKCACAYVCTAAQRDQRARLARGTTTNAKRRLVEAADFSRLVHRPSFILLTTHVARPIQQDGGGG